MGSSMCARLPQPRAAGICGRCCTSSYTDWYTFPGCCCFLPMLTWSEQALSEIADNRIGSVLVLSSQDVPAQGLRLLPL